MSPKSKEIRIGLGLGANTVRGIKQGLSAVFKFAVDEHLLQENPVKKTTVPLGPLSSANPLTIEESWALVSVKDHLWYGDAFTFCLHTGLRPEELAALIEDDIDFTTGKLRIERACKWIWGKFTGFGKVKCRRSMRSIKLAPEHLEFLKTHLDRQKKHIGERVNAGLPYGEPKVLEWVREYRSKERHEYTRTNLIFPSEAGTVDNLYAFESSFKRMLRLAGFTGSRLKVRLYDLRHTHATILLTLGFPDHEVASKMGHSVDTLNNTYAHEYPGRQRKASELFVSLIPLNTQGAVPPSEIQSHIKQIVDSVLQEFEEKLKGLLAGLVSEAEVEALVKLRP
jgi:integrase